MPSGEYAEAVPFDTATNLDGLDVIAVYDPAGIVRVVHVTPSGDDIATDDPTAA